MVFTWTHLGILIFFFVGFAMAAPMLIVPALIAPRTSSGDIGMPYECGMRPMGGAWVRFGVNYYVYALLFLAFDVDVLYLFPVSTYYSQAGGFDAFIKLFVFLFVLALAVIYFWAKGVFSWPKQIS